MKDDNHGWLIRYIHANGASIFFIVVYCYIFHGFYYGSYIVPSAALIVGSGVLIFILMMVTAFMGKIIAKMGAY